MEALWTEYEDSLGSEIADLSLAPGKTGQAVKITYDLMERGYVGIDKAFPQGILSGIERMSFWYKGNGASNTLEFKLIHAEEDCGGGKTKRAIFSMEWNQATNTGGQWQFKDVAYSDFNYWAGDPEDPDNPPTGCGENESLVFEKVDKIDFAVSSRPDLGDQAGEGTVVIDDVQAR